MGFPGSPNLIRAEEVVLMRITLQIKVITVLAVIIAVRLRVKAR